MDKIEVSFYTGSLNIQKIESKDGWEVSLRKKIRLNKHLKIIFKVLSHVFKTYSITTIVGKIYCNNIEKESSEDF